MERRLAIVLDRSGGMSSSPGARTSRGSFVKIASGGKAPTLWINPARPPTRRRTPPAGIAMLLTRGNILEAAAHVPLLSLPLTGSKRRAGKQQMPAPPYHDRRRTIR